MKLLLVEDDQSCVKMIKQAIGTLCSEVSVTDKLKEALLLLGTKEINAIWLDLSLTDSHAEETVQRIPEIRAKCPTATLLVVSGYGDSYKDEALHLGADAYAGKLDLDGFSQPAIADLLIKAALHAMTRGVDASFILERVSAFVQNLTNPHPLS